MAFELKAGFVGYDIQMQVYSGNTKITSDCNSIMFINYGTNPVIIENTIVLQQNQSLSIEGNQGEITSKQFQATFDISGAGTNNLAVVRKLFMAL